MTGLALMWTKLRPKLQLTIGLFSIIAILNFLLFMVITQNQGGSALNGKVENGHYYLGEHGHYTEVSQAVYLLNQAYEIITLAAFGVTFLIGVIYSLFQKFRGRDQPNTRSSTQQH